MSGARSERFPIEGHARLEAQLPSGHLEVAAGEPDEIVVEIRGPAADRFEVMKLSSGTVIVRPVERRARWYKHRVLARVPPGASLDAGVASADVTVTVDLGSLDARAASGDVTADVVAGDVELATASGDLRVRSIGGALAARGASGDVSVGSVAGAARLHTASGDVRLDRAEGAVDARTASGDIEVGRYEGDALDVKAMSGDVRVGIPQGRDLDVELHSLSGRIRTPFDVAGNGGAGSSEGRVVVRTVSGDISLTEAAASR